MQVQKLLSMLAIGMIGTTTVPVFACGGGGCAMSGGGYGYGGRVVAYGGTMRMAGMGCGC